MQYLWKFVYFKCFCLFYILNFKTVFANLFASFYLLIKLGCHFVRHVAVVNFRDNLRLLSSFLYYFENPRCFRLCVLLVLIIVIFQALKIVLIPNSLVHGMLINKEKYFKFLIKAYNYFFIKSS